MIRRHKYGAQRTEIDGISFHSKKEATRYCYLRLLEKSGNIKDLEIQPSFQYFIGDKLMFTYRADFRYREPNQGLIIEDVKGVRTPIFKLKKKIIEASHCVQIIEV